MTELNIHHNIASRRAKWLIGSGLWALLFGICLSPSSYAQTSHYRWYQVEMIVFARHAENYQEHWPNNIKLSYPLNWVELKSAATPTPAEAGIENAQEAGEFTTPTPSTSQQQSEAFVLLGNSDKKLTRYANALKKDSRYRILFHEGWRQFISGQKKAPAILISGGSPYGNHYELEGSITLSVAQYLQVQTNLWLSQFEINYGQAPGDWPQLPQMPNKVRANILANYNNSMGDQLAPQDPTAFDQWSLPTALGSEDLLSSLSEPYLIKRIATLKQDRRMRSSELHYIDHPLFGIVMQITPYAPAKNSQ